MLLRKKSCYLKKKTYAPFVVSSKNDVKNIANDSLRVNELIRRHDVYDQCWSIIVIIITNEYVIRSERTERDFSVKSHNDCKQVR